MNARTFRSAWALLIAFGISGCTSFTFNSPAPSAPAVLSEFAARLPISHQQVDNIIAAGEAAAARQTDHPGALINVPYNEQPAFAEDLLNRSGGLAGALPSDERPKLVTEHDVVLLSVRSWEKDGQRAAELIDSYHQRGWQVILFASAAGMPDNVSADFLIDNGAPTGGEGHGSVNIIANAVNGWLWVCEYTAALTRRGQVPGFLQSITMMGSHAHNRTYQRGRTRHNLYPTDARIEAGELSKVYLARVEQLIHDLWDEQTFAEIAAAADIIAERLNTGRRVFVSTNSHLMMNDIAQDHRAAWQPLNGAHSLDKPIQENAIGPGDLIVWFAFNGMSVWGDHGEGKDQIYYDFGRHIRESKADFILCAANDPHHPDNNGQGALAAIEQPWAFGDAEVSVPFAPGKIAPVSGLAQALLYRMLDHAVAERTNRL